MFFQIRDFVYLAVGALGTSIKLIKHGRLGRGRFAESITSIGKCDSTPTSHSPSFDSDSHDSVFYRVENRLELY